MTLTQPILAVLLALSLTEAAMAQTPVTTDEAVSTAARKPDIQDAEQAQKQEAARAAMQPATRALTTQEQIAAWLAASPPVRLADDTPGVARSDEDSPRQIHGSAGITLGTGGYRSAYVSALIPIGDNATLGLAVSQTDFGNRAVFLPHDDFSYGDAAGLGASGWRGDTLGYGRSGRWGRGGKQQSVAVSLAVGGEGRPPPEGCAPAFRDGGRYVEPLWATEMRGDRNPCAIDSGH